MTELSSRNFGLLIAYLIPGMVVVWAASYFSATANSWLTGVPEQPPSVAGFLYLTLASTAGGVIVSAIRWATLDTFHHWTGVTPPKWNFAAYPAKRAAFDAIVEDHYRFYQFYSGLFVAIALLFVTQQVARTENVPAFPMVTAGFVAVEVILFAGSRDALKKYYTRGTSLLGVTDFAMHENEVIPRPRKKRQNKTSSAASKRQPSPARFRKSESVMP